MKIVRQGWTWHIIPMSYDSMIEYIASAARTCYKSELKPIAEEEKFIKNLIKKGHESPLEHISLSLKLTTDRGVLAEITRHRISSYSVESTRFIKYKEIEFILPVWFYGEENFANTNYNTWYRACADCEQFYNTLIRSGQTPQQARQVLNQSLKTDIIITSNIRQWRTILKQRTAKDAHPQMRELMISILESFKKEYPCFFDDI